MQNTLKIPKFQNTLKIPKYAKIFNFFPNFPNFGAKFSHVFWGVKSFSTDFSERAWKMLKNAAFAVKIGVDTADILAFWAWNEFWYFACILVFWPSANSKRKCKHFALTLSTQPTAPRAVARLLHHRPSVHKLTCFDHNFLKSTNFSASRPSWNAEWRDLAVGAKRK